jgi:DNA replication ATP-dependent helicase Dna2
LSFHDNQGERNTYLTKYNDNFPFLNENLEIKKEFFARWHNFIDLEEEIVIKEKQQLFELPIQKKVESGTCVSDLRLVKICKTERGGIRGYQVLFSKNSNISGTNLILSKGDPVVVSVVEPKIFGIAIGFLDEINACEVHVTMDNNIDLDKTIFPETNIVYRIDKDELTSGFGLMRTNIIKLFTEQARHIQGFLVFSGQFSRSLSTSLEIPAILKSEYNKLNENQKESIRKIIGNDIFSIIVGMPGSGKSFLLSFVIALLVIHKKRILLSSYTHSAVDNILEKLSQEPYSSIITNVIRLGEIDRISKKIPKNWIFSERKFDSISEIDTEYESAQVVGTTCLGINHPLFLQMKFDYVFVDEASQVSLPVCLGPIRFGSKFVLVGDHNQLPPLIKNKKTIDLGLDKSLFEVLLEKYPESVVNLSIQYRMNGDIMGLANKLVYSDQLIAASNEIFNQKLNIEINQSAPKWILEAIKRSVNFVNTDSYPGSQEEVVGKSFLNRNEANLIKCYVDAIFKCNSDFTLGVISLYRPQAAFLAKELPEGVEISTVDQYQGRDRDLIIVSLVRSNEEGRMGELMSNIRRMNVAFTRAKKQLMIFGSRKIIESFCLSSSNRGWSSFWSYILEKNYILDVC